MQPEAVRPSPPSPPEPSIEDLAQAKATQKRFPQCHSHPMCLISIREQILHLVEDGQVLRSWPVSTSRYGVGNRNDSKKTPSGAHRVAERIGGGAPVHTIFRGRIAQARTAEVEAEPRTTSQDHVTTRILWLDGLESGFNRGGETDSHRRYIYIHGTHEEGLVGQAASIGCIRMRGADIIELFDRVSIDTLVLILP